MYNYFEVIFLNYEFDEIKFYFVYYFGFLELKKCNGLIKEKI